MARVTFEHFRGPCELVAAVNLSAGIYGVYCKTYDQYCRYPHDPVSFVVTGLSLFGACLEVYYYRRQDDRKLNLRLEQIEAHPPCLEREVILGLSSMHERVQQLWIPYDHVESLYKAAAPKLAALQQPQSADEPVREEVTA